MLGNKSSPELKFCRKEDKIPTNSSSTTDFKTNDAWWWSKMLTYEIAH